VVSKSGQRSEKMSFVRLLQSICSYFKLYGLRGGLTFAIGLLRCRTESIYSAELGKQKKCVERLINPEMRVKLIENAEEFDVMLPDYAAVTGAWMAQHARQLIISGEDYLAAVYKGGRFTGWGWVKKGPLTYGNCRLGKLDCVIHKCRTLREFRRQRVYTTLLISLMENLQQRGFRNVYIGAKSFNKASLKGIEKVGFEFVEQYDVGSFVSRLLYHLKGKGPKVMGG
jgi:hypothetical protein